MSIAYDYSHDTIRDGAVVLRKQLLIDGRHVESVSGRTFNTLNPATGEVIATISEGNEADVERAVAAARRAFEGVWSTMRPAERGHILFRLAELMKQHSAELAELESRDAGKPISAVLRQDLPAAIDTLTYYAGWADKIHGDTVPDAQRCADLHGARAGRRRRSDRAVEFPADDRHVEAGACAGLRLHHRHEARRTDLAVGAADRRTRAGGRSAAGRA